MFLVLVDKAKDCTPHAKRLDEQLYSFMSDYFDVAKVDVVRRIWV